VEWALYGNESFRSITNQYNQENTKKHIQNNPKQQSGTNAKHKTLKS